MIVLQLMNIPYSRKVWWGEVWQIDSVQAFGEKKFGELTDQPINYLLTWMILVWQITDDLPNSPNFSPAIFSLYSNIIDHVMARMFLGIVIHAYHGLIMIYTLLETICPPHLG